MLQIKRKNNSEAIQEEKIGDSIPHHGPVMPGIPTPVWDLISKIETPLEQSSFPFSFRRQPPEEIKRNWNPMLL